MCSDAREHTCSQSGECIQMRGSGEMFFLKESLIDVIWIKKPDIPLTEKITIIFLQMFSTGERLRNDA